MKDVCPTTRLRCATPRICNGHHCAFDRGLSPIDDRALSKAEQYALAMSDQKASTDE